MLKENLEELLKLYALFVKRKRIDSLKIHENQFFEKIYKNVLKNYV